MTPIAPHVEAFLRETLSHVDARQSILSYRSWTLWVLGYPEAALADADQTISHARGIGQAVTLIHALAHAPFTYCHCGNYATAQAQCDEAIALADEKGTLFWKAWAMMNQGGVSVLAGKASDAVATIISAITMWRGAGGAARARIPWGVDSARSSGRVRALTNLTWRRPCLLQQTSLSVRPLSAWILARFSFQWN